MERITVTVDDETVESLDRLAEEEHGGDRDEAARVLLAEWLNSRRRQ